MRSVIACQDMGTDHRLVITEIEAQNLGLGSRGEYKHKEQYVTASLKGKNEKTKDAGTLDQDESKLSTKWKEILQFSVGKNELKHGDVIKIKINQPTGWFVTKLLGKAELPVEDVISRKGIKKITVNLRDGNSRPLEAIFKCSLEYIRPGDVTVGETSDATPGKDCVDAGIPSSIGSSQRFSSKEIRKQIPYPEKPRDFQVRVKVIEGRHISGRNVSPVVRVTVGGVKKQTGVKYTSNQPYYNQTFSFNFTAKFRELFELDIMFEVFDSRRFRFNSLIGFYKCDVREVYNFEDHVILRKWIVLSEPQQREKIIQEGGVTTKYRQHHGTGGQAAGFLKVSMVVLQVGMSAPPLDNLGGSADGDDIESNMLYLPGVSLSPAIFSLKVHKASDIPQMDPPNLFYRFQKGDNKKNDCADPYCIFSFAGKEATSSIRYDSRSPEFNETLNIPFKYPSVCDKLKIQLMDSDVGTNDDYIGTIYLPVSQLSGQAGKEFLPTFGPCFVNMYGSPREYSDWPNKYEYLDKGIGEGAAYRGRVLVELVTKLNENMGLKVEQVTSSDIARFKSYMRTKKFRLSAVFLEATMLAIEDAQVEFELSIGNYGNKLDNSVSPRPSTTPPTNPVFDGEKYYYLPWANSKPYVRIDCDWEDICFRLGALNKLLKMSGNLERSIDMLKLTASTSQKENDYKNAIYDTLDALITDCGSLPKLDAKECKLTKLDLQMNEMRREVLASIAAECEAVKSNLDKYDIIQTLENFLRRVQMIAVEPQNSIPDVIIWMIKAEKERVAYCRIPANELLYCKDESERGKHCGKTIDVNLKFPGKDDSSHKSKFAGMLRLLVWFGPEEHQGEWTERERTGGALSVYAERYENQTFWFGKWRKKNLSRPAFSNASGTLYLPEEKFKPPEGWKFVGNWEVHSELSTQLRKDAGCKVFCEDVFENEHRFVPGGVWAKNISQKWTDAFGNLILDEHNNALKDKNDIKPPKGWQWSQKWIVDQDRAVDYDGWEYTLEASYGSTDYEASEKTFHFCRRRRWTRERKIVNNVKATLDQLPVDKEGWEYAFTFKSKFHAQEKPLYNVRRKRLRRKLEGDKFAPEPVFILENEDKGENAVLVPPTIFLSFKEPIVCQLRAYLFQGRNLLPSDPDGLADPFVRLSFGIRSATSRTIKKKLNPRWDQMLVLESVPIYGHSGQIVENPPDVVLELFDWDPVGKNEFLGRVQVEPIVFQTYSETPRTHLSWLGVYKDSRKCGDILAAFELYLDEEKTAPALPAPNANGWFPIPHGIRPPTQRKAVEILCWGLRNLRRYHWRRVKSPSIEIEIANEIQKKSVVDNVNGNSNFEDSRILCFDVNLPCDPIYLPAITIQLKTSSGHSPIGICVVENLHKYGKHKDDHHSLLDKIFPSVDAVSVVVDNESQNNSQGRVQHGNRNRPAVDWWMKYYAAKRATNRDQMYPKIYTRSLEEEFDHFRDFIKTFKFRRGKMEYLDEDDEDSIVGEFKGALATYDLPDDFHATLCPRVFKEEKFSHMYSMPCIVRVYVVKAYELTPKDKNGLADPYLVVSLGDETFDNKKDYQADTLEAEFGKVFEFHAVIPDVKDLTIQVLDSDYGNDDFIGETRVDLENRLLTRRHAIAGLPSTYHISGPNKWRLGTQYTPSFILNKYCEDLGIQHYFSKGDNSMLTLKCGGKERPFTIQDFEDSRTDLTHAGDNMERLSLHVLNSLQGEHKMVPEHVETRDLTNDLFPGFSQGKLEMFIDIFPDDPETYGQPGPPIDISPPEHKKFELRLIVWNTKDVQLRDTNIYGDEMSDIFVKCRMTGIDNVQKTDTHFRSLNGDGMFNYRMVFSFEYSETKCKCIVMKKAHFLSRRKYMDEVLPELVVEIWDNDLMSTNDFIGDVKLDLHELPKPCGRSKDVKDWPLSDKTNSLFEKRRVNGWWPIVGEPTKKDKKKDPNVKKNVLTGKVELTLELLDEEDAKARPVGKGQSAPNQHPVLEKPQRPATSFLWILNPWKSFRYVFWSHFKWYFFLLVVLILLALLVALFIYSTPGYTVKKLFNT